METLQMKWNWTLVLLSFCTSVFGSWCSLVMIETAIFSKWTKRNPTVWIVLGGISLGGCGIWTMHFVGMAALDLGIPFSFNIGLAITSLICSILSVTLGLYIALERTDKKLMFEILDSDEKDFKVRIMDMVGVTKHPTVLFCGVLVAAGVLIMHYLGMMSVVIQADVRLVPGILVASILIAVFAATAAIILVFFLKGQWIRPLSSIVMGVAVCTMHYTGMHAMVYQFNPSKYVILKESPKDMAIIALVLSCLLCLSIQAVASVQASGRVKLYNSLLKRNEALKILKKRLLMERNFLNQKQKMLNAVHLVSMDLEDYHLLLDVQIADEKSLPKFPSNIKGQFDEIKSIFEHPLKAELFKMHCLKENTFENFAFVQALKVVKEIPAELKGQRTEAISIIIKEFLKSEARFEVNITKECKMKIVEKAVSGAEVSLSDLSPAYEEVLDLIRNNSYRTFCNSHEGLLSRKLALQFPLIQLPDFTEDLNDLLGSEHFSVDGGSSKRRSSIASQKELEKLGSSKLTTGSTSRATDATGELKVKPLVVPTTPTSTTGLVRPWSEPLTPASATPSPIIPSTPPSP